ncbi:MAG: sulfate ABC transporter permease subunit [Kofleriaceae bacterium]
MRRLLIGIAVVFLAVIVVTPLVVVFATAFRDGLGPYWHAVSSPETRAALKLTAVTAGIAVPLGIAFGVAAAWAIARFRFRGRVLLVALIDLPFAVSPVVVGLMFVLLFGARGFIHPPFKIIFATPGIVLATAFVTLPFVARELIPALEARGPAQELAALTLGASPWQMFRRITLPLLKKPLAYGAILCTARAIGEFGAVSVVSGHVRGETTTVPLHIEILYNDFQYQAAFAVATLLVVISLAVVLLLRAIGRHE